VSGAAGGRGKFFTPHRVFTIFKYTVYILLAYNILLWFQEDLAASAETFGNTVTWRNVVEAYSATFDTAAWVILLLMFELETAVVPDEKLKGGLKLFFTAISLVCYFFIVYSFWGYCVKFGMISNVVPFDVADICSLIGADWNYIASLDDYPPLDVAACTAMQGQQVLQVAGTDILGTAESHRGAFGLAVIDIINAGTWLIIVALLEIEVFLQLRDALSDRIMKYGKYVKGFFYLILFVCAAYWGLEGTFLDFWDAFLWLVAFIFIELNIFQWHEEVEDEIKPGDQPASFDP
jgi:hypothetical protein